MALVMKLQDGGEPDVAHIVTINGKDYDYDVLRQNVMARTPYYITRVKRGKKHKDRITSAVNQYIDALGETVNGKQRMDWFDNYARDYKGELTNLDKRRDFNDENGVAATIIGAVIDETDPIVREEKPQFTSSIFSQGLANELFGENAGEPIYNSFMNLDQVVNGQRDNSVRIGEFKRALQAYKNEFDKLYGTRYDFGDGTIEDWSGKLDNIISDLDEGLSPEELYDLDRILGTYNGRNTWSSLFDTTVVPNQAQIEQEYRQQQAAAQQRQNLLDNNYIFHDRDNNEFILPKTANQSELFDAWYKHMYPEEISAEPFALSNYTYDWLSDNLNNVAQSLQNISTENIINSINDLWNVEYDDNANDMMDKWNVSPSQLLQILYFYLGQKHPELFETIDNDYLWLKGTYKNGAPVAIHNRNRTFKQTSQLDIPSLRQKIQEEFQTEMQNNQMVPSQKEGGIMKFQDASGNFKAVNKTDTHNWWENYMIGDGNVYSAIISYINGAPNDEEKQKRINEVNDYQKAYKQVATNSTWNKNNSENAWEDESVGKLQTAFKELGNLKLNQYITHIYDKGGYNLSGKRLESDRPTKEYKPDNLFSQITADRNVLGSSWNDLNPAQIQTLKQLADQAGLEWYKDSEEDPNFVGLFRLKQQPQEESVEEEVSEEPTKEEPVNEILPVVPEEDPSDTTKGKFKKDKTAIRQQRRENLRGIGRSIGQFFPNAIHSIGRLFSDLRTARRIKKNYNKLKPDIFLSEQHSSRVQGSYPDSQTGQQVKGETQILRPEELSSDAEKNEAIRLQREENAEKRFRYYLDLDTKRRRETEQNAEKTAQYNTHNRVETANIDRKNISNFLESQADIYAAWQKARGTSIDEFIKENQYNLFNQRNKREKLVSQVLSGRELLDYQNAVRKFDAQWVNNWKQKELEKYKKMTDDNGKPLYAGKTDEELLAIIGNPSYMEKAYDTEYNSVLNQLGDIYVNRGLQNSLKGGYQFWGQSGVAGMDWGDYINYDNFLNTYFNIPSKRQGGKLLRRRKYANNS